MSASTAPVFADVVRPGKDKKISAKASGRKITVRSHSSVTVRRTFWAWLFGPKRTSKKHGRQPLPTEVQFYVQGVEGLKWREPWFIFSGKLTIVAPAGSGDQWRRSGKEKPHRLRFGTNKRARAKMLAVAWSINLGSQRWGGEPLGRLPLPEAIPPNWWDHLRAAFSDV